MAITQHDTSTTRVVHQRSPGSLALAALALAGPVLLLASELTAVRWPEGLSEQQEAAFLLAHVDRFTVSYLLGLAAAAALAGGYSLAAVRVPGRVARVAAAFGVVGAIGFAGHMAASLVHRDLLVADPEAWRARGEIGSGVTEIATILPTLLGVELGIILLGIALLRARWAAWWVAVAGVLAVVGDMSPTSYNTVIYAAFALLVFGVMAVRVARTPD